MVVGALAGLLVTAAVIGAAGSLRAHGAYRESLRELRDGDRRLEPGTPGRRLEDELRWYAEVSAAARDSGWRLSAAAVLVLCALAAVPGIWALSAEPSDLVRASVVVLLAAAVLVAALCVLDGRRSEELLRSAARRSALGHVRRLEDSLAAVHRATVASRSAHRSWLRTRAADYPLASVLASYRRRMYERAVARRSRAVSALARSVPVSLSGVSVRAPDGYAEGLRGLPPLATGGPLDDDTWAGAVADLGQAAERDLARRTRWLSALAACAELRSDPPARESAARWALDAAALPPRAVGDPRTDPLPDAVAFEPVRPGTWEAALRRARHNAAGPLLLAEVTLRWAYALVSSETAGTPPPRDAGDPYVPPGPAEPPTKVLPTARDAGALAPRAPTLAGSTAAPTAGPAHPPPGAATAGSAAPGAATVGATTAGGPAPSGATAGSPSAGGGVAEPRTLALRARRRPPGGAAPAPGPGPAAVLDPAVDAAAEIMAETSDPDEYLRRVRPGFESLGATSVQLSRLVPAWPAPVPAPSR